MIRLSTLSPVRAVSLRAVFAKTPVLHLALLVLVITGTVVPDAVSG